MNYTEDVGYNFGKVDDLHVLDDAFRLQILKIEDKKNWLGLNQLGICLEITRDLLRQQEKMPNSEINPWTRKIILKEIRNEEKIHKGDKIIK